MSRTYLPAVFSVLLGVTLCVFAGRTSVAQAQGFPDPLKTNPAEGNSGVFSGLGRNGYGKRPPNPFRVTLSYHSSDSRTINRGLGTFAAVDVQYDAFTSTLLGGPTLIGFFADINGGERFKRSESAQFDVRIIGVGMMARRVFTESLDRSHFYVGAGAGFYTTRLDIDPSGPQRYEENGSSLGIRFQGGYQFTRNFYAQFDLLSLESIRTRNADGRTVRVNPSGGRVGIGYQF
ncbi:MAG: hypothetical protein H7145_19390 [Akkermansiaceae bacterium]|nr:hypothetical protein [Armatimonadota bacterium]